MTKIRTLLAVVVSTLALAFLFPVAASAQVTISNVQVQIGGATFALWGSQSLSAGQSLVLTQNPTTAPTPAYNFDSSDDVPAGSPPATVSGMASGFGSFSFTDSTRVLTVANKDPGGFSFAEAQDYTQIGSFTSNGLVITVSVAYADNAHSNPCGSDASANGLNGSSTCFPSNGPFAASATNFFQGSAQPAPSGYPSGTGPQTGCSSSGGCYDSGVILFSASPAAPTAHIKLSKTPDGGTFTSGGQLKFTMVVTSDGGAGSTAQNVMLTDPLPTTNSNGKGTLNWSLDAADSSPGVGGECTIDSSENLSCSLGNLANGQSVTVVVVSQVNTPSGVCDGSKINNTATATATNAPTVTDSGSYSCSPCNISATALDFNGNKVTFSLTNGNSTDATLSQIQLTFPFATNGHLQKVMLGAATIYGGPNLTSPANITTFSGTTAQRTIASGGSATITLQFEHNADTNDAHYSGTFTFGNCPVTIPGGCVLGYPFTSSDKLTSVIFNESGVLQQINPLVATMGGTIQVYATDEHAPLLGVRPPTVSPLPSNPGHVTSPLTGDPNAMDAFGRFIHPGLFITDVTGLSDNSTHTDPTYRAGDWQFCSTQGGGTGCLNNGVPPDDVFGTWKGATAGSGGTFTTDADPATQNKWNLGPGSDTPTGGFGSLDALGYGTEFRWNVNTLHTSNGVALLSGHTYRVQAIVHDGDQNKSGGDVGQACALINLQ